MQGTKPEIADGNKKNDKKSLCLSAFVAKEKGQSRLPLFEETETNTIRYIYVSI
jgi:hypothetical protein